MREDEAAGGAWAALGPAILVANVRAGLAQSRFERAVALLTTMGVPLAQVYTVTHVAEFRPIIAAAVERGVKCVIVGGGDGTISAVVDDLVRANLVMGVLPLGTANDFVRNLGLDPLDLDAACATIAAGNVQPVNLGCANGDYFANVATVGIGAAVTRQLTPELKARFGSLAYPTAAARALSGYSPFRVRITLESASHSIAVHQFRALHVAVANGRYHGGGMTAAPNADLTTPHLAVSIFGIMNPLELGRVLLSLRSGGRPDSRYVRFYRADTVTVETPGQIKPVNLDGELTVQTPVTIQMQLGAVQVLTPLAPMAG